MSIDNPTRRPLLRGGAGLGMARLAAPSWAEQTPQAASPTRRPAGVHYAYVGCYTTTRRYARGDGIHVYRVEQEAGAWTHVQHVGSLVNPSFLVLSRDERYLYSVHGYESYATSFSVDRNTGFLTLLNRVETGGQNGVHQAFDASGKFMVVANYSTGNVSVLPVRPDGTLGD